jgi:hypothetical protein
LLLLLTFSERFLYAFFSPSTSSPIVGTLLCLPRGEARRIDALVTRVRVGVDFDFAMDDGVLGWCA